MNARAGDLVEIQESAVTDRELSTLGLGERSRGEDRWLAAVVETPSDQAGALFSVKIGSGRLYGIPAECWRPQTNACPWCGHVIVVDTNWKSPDPPGQADAVWFWAGCSNDDCPVQPRTWDCGSMEEAERLWDRRAEARGVR